MTLLLTTRAGTLLAIQRQRETHEFNAAVGGLVQQAAFRAGFAVEASLDQARVASRVFRLNKQRFTPRRGVVCRLLYHQVTSAGDLGWVAEVCRATKAHNGALAHWIPERTIKRDGSESITAIVRNGHRATKSPELWAAPHAYHDRTVWQLRQRTFVHPTKGLVSRAPRGSVVIRDCNICSETVWVIARYEQPPLLRTTLKQQRSARTRHACHHVGWQCWFAGKPG